MSQAKGDSREVIFDAEGDEGELPWQAKWKRTIFPGWKAADEKDTSVSLAQKGDEIDQSVVIEEQEGEKAWKVAEALKPGQTIQWKSLTSHPKESKPQGRYTEATLVRELEKKGIGRPSTFASLIATLV
jgi:DNA topoisomerase-1